MITRENYLRSKKDFNNVFKKGKTIAGKLVFLKITKNNLDINRFAFIISSKISKKAVIRNKIRRRLREIIRNDFNNIKTGFDIIIIVKPEIVGKNYQEIKNDLENFLKIL